LLRIIFDNFGRIIIAKKCDRFLSAYRSAVSAFQTEFAVDGFPVFDRYVCGGTVRLAITASDTFFQINFYHDDSS
jgi:hypothetical protein